MSFYCSIVSWILQEIYKLEAGGLDKVAVVKLDVLSICWSKIVVAAAERAE